jgi:hypothetical protein
MPRTSLMVLAVLLGALGAAQVTRAFTIAPSAGVMAASAPDGRDEPGQTADPRRGRQASGDSGGGVRRSGDSDPAASPRPNFGPPTLAVPARPNSPVFNANPNPNPNPGFNPNPSFNPTLNPAFNPKLNTSPDPSPNPPPKATSLPPSMVFFVAQGDDNSCGPGCSAWIGADGAIDAGAAGRLRALLNRLGDRKLPIYFHSPGGSVEGSLAIGRLMRARGLTAGVAWTVPQGCDSRQAREEACDRIKRSGRDLPAQLDTARTMCFSACVYAIVGAAVRDIAPGARLGIHSSSFSFADRDEHIKPPPRVMRETIEASYARLGRYFTEMGIDPALVAAAREISNDRIRVLTRAEIWRFKIDRRGFVEDGWRLTDPATRAIHKTFVADRGHADFREALVNLTCGAPDRVRIDVAIEHVSGDAIAASGFRLVVGGTSRTLTPRRRMTFGASRTEYEVSSVDVQPSFFLSAGGSINVAVATSAASEPSFRSTDFAASLSTSGLMPALAKLLPLCGMSADSIKAEAAPRSIR